MKKQTRGISKPPERLTLDELRPYMEEYFRRQAVGTGRPRKLVPCAGCGTELGARERRYPCPKCGRYNREQGAR